jgi:hypothetical protein
VRRDRNRDVTRNETIHVGLNSTELVGVNRFEFVGVARELVVGGTLQVGVGAWMNEGVGLWKRETVGRSKTVVIKKNLTERIGGNHVETVKNLDVTATDEHIQLTRGASTIVMKDESTVLTCGQSSITLEQAGKITIKATNIEVESTEDTSLDAKGKLFLVGEGGVEMSGSEYELNTTKGDGHVKATQMVKINAPQVQINC